MVQRERVPSPWFSTRESSGLAAGLARGKRGFPSGRTRAPHLSPTVNTDVQRCAPQPCTLSALPALAPPVDEYRKLPLLEFGSSHFCACRALVTDPTILHVLYSSHTACNSIGTRNGLSRYPSMTEITWKVSIRKGFLRKERLCVSMHRSHSDPSPQFSPLCCH